MGFRTFWFRIWYRFAIWGMCEVLLSRWCQQLSILQNLSEKWIAIKNMLKQDKKLNKFKQINKQIFEFSFCNGYNTIALNFHMPSVLFWSFFCRRNIAFDVNNHKRKCWQYLGKIAKYTTHIVKGMKNLESACPKTHQYQFSDR